MSANFRTSVPNSYTSSDRFKDYLNYQAHYGGQPSGYPLFHSAAVAAVAAVAAEYSQHFNTNNNTPSLNLAPANQIVNFNNLPGYTMNNINQSNLGQTLSSQNLINYDQFSELKAPINKPLSVSTSVFDPNLETINPLLHGSNLRDPDRVLTGKSKSSKGRKSIPLTDSSQKRKEFEELVKARTNMLMQEGTASSTSPLTHSSNAGGMGSSSSSGSLTGVPSMSCKDGSLLMSGNGQSHHALLMQAILECKKKALMRSPGVVASLARQQRVSEQYKRQTELFNANIRGHQASLHAQFGFRQL